MTAIVETLLMCDGGSMDCHFPDPFNMDHDKTKSVSETRKVAKKEGWVKCGGKDYCPACAERLGFKPVGWVDKFR